VLTSAGGQCYWPVVLIVLASDDGQWCCPVLLSSLLANLASLLRGVRTQPAAKSVPSDPPRSRPTFGTRIPGAKVDTPVVSTNRWVDTLACRLLRPESGSRIGPAFWFQNAARGSIDVFGTCCEGSWPMMPASGADQWWWPVLLASGVNCAGQ
jgi:hypothetical protein